MNKYMLLGYLLLTGNAAAASLTCAVPPAKVTGKVSVNNDVYVYFYTAFPEPGMTRILSTGHVIDIKGNNITPLTGDTSLFYKDFGTTYNTAYQTSVRVDGDTILTDGPLELTIPQGENDARYRGGRGEITWTQDYSSSLMNSTSLYWQVTGESSTLKTIIMTVPVIWTVAWRDYTLNVPDSISIDVDSGGEDQTYTIAPQGEASDGMTVSYTLREQPQDGVHILFDNGDTTIVRNGAAPVSVIARADKGVTPGQYTRIIDATVTCP